MNEVQCLQVRVDNRAIVAILVLLAGFSVFFMLTTMLPRNEALGPVYSLLRGYGSLSAENTTASWYSSMAFAAAAAAMLLCFLAERRFGRSPSEGLQLDVRRYGWLAMALVFALLSLDEMGSLHERLDRLPFIPGLLSDVDVFGPSWVNRLIVPIALIAGLLLFYAWTYLRTAPAALISMVLGICLLLSVPLQEHLEEHLEFAPAATRDEHGGYSRPGLHQALEEGTEMLGALCFLAAPLLYLRGRSGAADGHATSVTLTWKTIATLGLLPGAGLLAVILFIPHLLNPGDHRGVPQNWFPSVMAISCAALCILAARAQQTDAPDRVLRICLLLAFSVVSVALSIDHGMNHRLVTQRLLSPPEWAQAIVTAVQAMTGMLVVAAAVTFRCLALRLALVVWAAGLWFGLPASVPVRSVLPYVSYLALSVGVACLLPGGRLRVIFGDARTDDSRRARS